MSGGDGSYGEKESKVGRPENATEEERKRSKRQGKRGEERGREEGWREVELTEKRGRQRTFQRQREEMGWGRGERDRSSGFSA